MYVYINSVYKSYCIWEEFNESPEGGKVQLDDVPGNDMVSISGAIRVNVHVIRYVMLCIRGPGILNVNEKHTLDIYVLVTVILLYLKVNVISFSETLCRCQQIDTYIILQYPRFSPLESLQPNRESLFET